MRWTEFRLRGIDYQIRRKELCRQYGRDVGYHNFWYRSDLPGQQRYRPAISYRLHLGVFLRHKNDQANRTRWQFFWYLGFQSVLIINIPEQFDCLHRYVLYLIS